MLDMAADKFGTRTYVSNKEGDLWKDYSFLKVRELSYHIASFLKNIGIEKENNIVILSEGRSRWVIAELGIIASGGVSVPLSIKLQIEEIPFRINHSEAKAVFISKNYTEKLFIKSNEFDNKDLYYLYLDDDKEFIIEKAKELGIDEKKIFSFDEILTIGKKSYSKNQKYLDKIKENIRFNDTVTISYTSGTTGNPKGIMLTHRNYWVNCKDAVEIFKVPENFKTLLVLPCDHSFAHTVGIFAALLRGINLYFVDARGGGVNTLKNIPKNLTETNSDFLLTVPALTGNFMNKIHDAIEQKGSFVSSLFKKGIKAGINIYGNTYNNISPAKKILNFPIYLIAKLLIFKKIKGIWGSDIKYFVGGGALLDVYQQEFFYSIGVPVFQGYGLTEAAPIISANTPYIHKLGTSGKVLPSVDCRIIDDEGNELPKGEKGQIIVKGDNVMKGYYNNPEETAKTIKDDWLYTGDLGYFDNDNFLVVTGREKALLISEDGEKYSPEEIEEAIVSNSEFIAQVMLYNDHKKITSSLITLNKERLNKHLKTYNIKGEKEVVSEISKSMKNFKNNKNYKGKFPEKWLPSTFRIIEEPFSEQNKMINSTMKMVRYKIVENYSNDIELMHSKDGNKIVYERNIDSIKSIL
jgi:long-chain acyl-CoA synthetase